MVHKAGWVHRDLSPKNLYLYIDPDSGEKRGIIGDFEFSKRAGSGEKGDYKIVCLFSSCLFKGINLCLLVGYTRIHGLGGITLSV